MMLRTTTSRRTSALLLHPRSVIRPLVVRGIVTETVQEEAILTTHERNAQLRKDVKVLGRMLGDAIKTHAGPETFEKVEDMRKLAKTWRKGDPKAFQQLNDNVASYSIDDLGNVSRAFANFLSLANAAETHNRVRVIKDDLIESDSHMATSAREDSIHGTIARLLSQGKTPNEIYHAIISQKIELVLTAHPTEVNRRTFLNKQKKVAVDMEKLHFQRNTKYELKEVTDSLRREITSIWNSDLIRRVKPTPIDEAKGGLAVVEQVLWDAVPSYLRKLDATMQDMIGMALPITTSPIRFASWMGGDRDGNPNVTPTVTRAVLLRSRWQALRLLIRDVRELKMALSSTRCNDELRQIVGADAKEPYRVVTKELEEQLEATIHLISEVMSPEGTLLVEKLPKLPIETTNQVMSKLLLLHRSLVETNQKSIADGLLTDVIRRLASFGMTLLPLDIRQESVRHTEAIDAITRYLGIGSYEQWDETTRVSWLLNELVAKRPLLPKEQPLSSPDFNFSEPVVDVLETFRMLPELGDESLGAYVISMAKRTSDVLAVKLLMKEFGLKRDMRVVPLFETLDDLQNAPEQVEALFTNAWYRGRIQGKQEIMIGYSDSSKDAGRLAALWGQYEAQEKLAAIARKHGIELTFFHGKGGTVSRGGNPSMYKALIAQPPYTLNGRFRVTEQGEMISQNFGHRAIAERTLDLYSAGVLMEGFQTPCIPKEEWRTTMKQLAELGCEAYRKVVRGDPRFVPYFRSATPEPELGSTNIGSRPQKRRPGGVESLRAIPWVFSWTQTRLQLTGWLGVGDALTAAMKSDPQALKDMYRKWPFFFTNVDLVDMILAKADLEIAENYDNLLVTDPEHKKLGKELRAKMGATVDAILKVSGNKKLQQDNPDLQWAIVLRNGFLDPLNILQGHVLKRLRNGEYQNEAERQKLQDALVVTINGISHGLRNSG